MKRGILNTMLRKATVMSFALLFLCHPSCTSQDNVENQDPIIGKWRLVKITAPTGFSTTYSTVEIILEFKPDNIVAVQCLRQDNNCDPWNYGSYLYSYIDSNYGAKIQIGNVDWWYRVSEERLMIGRGPVDGLSYYFERM